MTKFIPHFSLYLSHYKSPSKTFFIITLSLQSAFPLPWNYMLPHSNLSLLSNIITSFLKYFYISPSLNPFHSLSAQTFIELRSTATWIESRLVLGPLVPLDWKGKRGTWGRGERGGSGEPKGREDTRAVRAREVKGWVSPCPFLPPIWAFEGMVRFLQHCGVRPS